MIVKYFTLIAIYFVLTNGENTMESESEDIILDSDIKNQKSMVARDQIIDPFENIYTAVRKITTPFRDVFNFLYDEPSRRSTRVSRPEKKYGSHRLHRKIIYHNTPLTRSHKGDEKHKSKYIDTVNANKRMFDISNFALRELCKRQFSPICNGLTPTVICPGPECPVNGRIMPQGCLPGMPNCILTPISPGQVSQASGIVFIPKECLPGDTSCNTPKPSTTPVPTLIPGSFNTPPQEEQAANSVRLPPTTVELKLSQESVTAPECCTSTCQDHEDCVVFHGKKYRLVPYQPKLCNGPECSDFMESPPPLQHTIPVPEDCLSTLKDMDFKTLSLKEEPLCQRATLKVVMNLGRSLPELIRSLNQIYNIGGCSLNARDTKLISRTCHQLLLNGCCSPTGGNIIKIGGGCKK